MKILGSISFFFLFISFYINVIHASHKVLPNFQCVPASKVQQIHRTGFHFQPEKHWMNDPNGPMYYNGIYHLFYQYNPKGSVWGNIVWAHSVSTDLINWKSLEPAIYASKPFDKYGCWSGSATILPGNKPIIMYTGIVEPEPKNTQVQNYAIPANYSDPYLQKWVKPDNNPLIVPNEGQNSSLFRDPTTAWFGNGHWKLVVGSRRKHRGVVYLYRSRDFMRWIKSKHPLHSRADTYMWECPDFYPVALQGKNGLETSETGTNVKHVLKVSLDVTRFEYYTIGTYNPDKDRYFPDNTSVDGWSGLRYDYGNYYASKTFFDPAKKRRILWGWGNESDTSDQDKQKGWAGIQTIPRQVWLDPSGKQLLQWPIEEVEKLRGTKIHMDGKLLNNGDIVQVKGITAAQADVDVTFSFESLSQAEVFELEWEKYDAQKICGIHGSTEKGGLGPFGLLTLASETLEEYVPVFFRVFKARDNYKVLLCSDATRSSLMEGLYRPSFAGFVDVDLADMKLSLRTLIDNSVVESFGARGKTCITSRVYPTLAINEKAHLYVFNNGTEKIMVETLDAWSMKKPTEMNN